MAPHPHPEFAAFKSTQTHLVVFEAGLVAVSRVAYDEALASEVSHLTGHALTHAFGVTGVLLTLAVHAEEMYKDPPKAPVLEPVPLEDLLTAAEPSALVHGQIAKDLRRSAQWPGVEWFRPVLVFPRACIVAIEVPWTSTVRWSTADGSWRTDINFWRVTALRRRLLSWGYRLR